MFYTYILYSPSTDRYYTGYTSTTPQKRLERHNKAINKSTKNGVPWQLQFYRSFSSRTEAFRFEKFIKRQKSRTFIEKLIDSNENECID